MSTLAQQLLVLPDGNPSITMWLLVLVPLALSIWFLWNVGTLFPLPTRALRALAVVFVVALLVFSTQNNAFASSGTDEGTALLFGVGLVVLLVVLLVVGYLMLLRGHHSSNRS